VKEIRGKLDVCVDRLPEELDLTRRRYPIHYFCFLKKKGEQIR
jgi:hypothetical protein